MLWYHCNVKESILIITKSGSAGLIMAHKKGKTTNARRWVENELELFAEVLAHSENNFAIFIRNWLSRS